MTTRIMDSYDHYTTSAQELTKWTSRVISTITAGAGRNGTAGLRLGAPDEGVRKVAVADQFHYCGSSFKFTGVSPSADVPLFSFRDGASEQVDLRLTTAGKLRVTRNGTTLATGTTTLTAGVSVYIEFAVKIHGSTGTYDVWINGASAAEITGTGANTQATGNANADTFVICSRVNGNTVGQTDVDDTFWNSNNTSAETRWGDTRIQAIFPNGNGNSSQWLGSDGNSVDNYLLVDEATPNDDTDYIASSTVNDIDLFTYQDVTPTTGSVMCVIVYMWARKDDAGTRTIAAVQRESATNTVGGNFDLSTSYNYYAQVWALNPRTSAAWSISDVNGDEYGIKEIA